MLHSDVYHVQQGLLNSTVLDAACLFCGFKKDGRDWRSYGFMSLCRQMAIFLPFGFPSGEAEEENPCLTLWSPY